MCVKWLRIACGRARRIGSAARVEVVVVEHDPRPAIAARLGQHGARERLVHGHVSALPGTHDAGVDDRPLGQVPHLVLQEPQERVGDHVVGGLVDRALDRCEPQADRVVAAGQPRAAASGSAAARRSPSLIAAATQVTGTWRPTWPSAVTRPPEPRRGRSEPSAAATKVTGPRFVAMIRRRSPSSAAAAAPSSASDRACGRRRCMRPQKRLAADTSSRPRMAPGKIPRITTPATESARATEPKGEVSSGAGSGSGSRMYM